MDRFQKQMSVDGLDFADYLDSLLLCGECVDIEFKTASNGFPNSLWETYSSFANTDGGTIVLGIREKGKQLFVDGLEPEQVIAYKQVYPKLSAVLPKPFQLENGIRQDETATHTALREAFVNALIHCDYMEDGNITIEQWKDHYTFKNPGTLLVSKAQYYAGGESLCRNKSLQKMFMMIGFSEKAGSGVNKIFAGWEKANWKSPFMEELNRPDRVILHLPMESLFPDDVVIELKKLLGDNFERMAHEQLSVLAICFSEGQITNERLQYVFNKHSSDITKILKALCDDGYLTSYGSGRGTKYHVNHSSGKVESNPGKVESNSGKVESIIVQAKYIRYQDMCELISSVSSDYISLEEIAGLIKREPLYLINKIIPRMISEGRLERLYPATPKHPQQKYRTTSRSKG